MFLIFSHKGEKIKRITSFLDFNTLMKHVLICSSFSHLNGKIKNIKESFFSHSLFKILSWSMHCEKCGLKPARSVNYFILFWKSLPIAFDSSIIFELVWNSLLRWLVVKGNTFILYLLTKNWTLKKQNFPLNVIKWKLSSKQTSSIQWQSLKSSNHIHQ